MIDIIVCGPDDFHPYECGGNCIHCRFEVTSDHDPQRCYLCHWDDDDFDPDGGDEEKAA